MSAPNPIRWIGIGLLGLSLYGALTRRSALNLGLRVSTWVSSLAHRSNMVAWEKEPRTEILPDLDARSSDA